MTVKVSPQLGHSPTKREEVLRDVEVAREKGWLKHFTAAAARHGVPLKYPLAVASRESHMGRVLNNHGAGTDHYSIMQVLRRAHQEFTSTHEPSNVRAYVMYGTKLLRNAYDRFGRWDAALASYNAGPDDAAWALRNGKPLDSVTTDSYVSDTTLRAKWIEERLRELGISTQPTQLVPTTAAGLKANPLPAIALLSLAGGGAYWYSQR